MSDTEFSRRLLAWYDEHGRHDLPWQHPASPYRVWLSEVMLQQTQVATVIPYFERFVARFPDLASLAAASEDEVLALWSGLGYYSRARNLHKAARIIAAEGGFPDSPEALMKLPGIGRSTAGAIFSIALGGRAPILDGNVKRVLCRFHRIAGWPGNGVVEKKLWALAERHTPQQRVADYTQAIMDLGATVCTRSKPACHRCPMSEHCEAFAAGEVNAYPQPKPKKEIPLRSCWLLIAVDHQHRVMLERRPPAGIWGGLWSLPEFDSEEALASRLGIDSDDGERLPPFVHRFTHFALEARPLRVRAERLGTTSVSERESAWLTPDEWAELGLPSPVRSLLERVFCAPAAASL